jgi:hypothetical protein
MNESIFVTAILLLLVGAMGFYFYTRIAYTDKKLGLLESLLLDLKMHMDMEAPLHIPPPLKEPEPFEPEDSEELKADEAAMYTSVMESAAATDVPDEVVVTMAADVTASTVDYDSMGREDLMTLAQKKGLRVTKSMKKGAIVNLLRESEKNSSPVTNMDGASESSEMGAPISMEDTVELPMESLSQ